MERYQRAQGKPRLLGNHQKCWIWGRHPVLETLRAGRWPVFELWLDAALVDESVREALACAELLKIPVNRCSTDEILRLCHSAEHQGYLAKMGEFPYAEEDQLFGEGRTEAPGFYLLLDGIQDPHNLGAILRSAEVFGATAVVLAGQGQVGVTRQVARSSAGAVNRVTLVQSSDLPSLAGRLKHAGVRVVGASEKATEAIDQFDWRGPVALVVGNEGHGHSPEMTEQIETWVRIPQDGQIGSLNAAVAAAICCYEIRRQRRMGSVDR
jgi:23S rRNA (guanosine2251-2'-O)-methyltransferase